MLRGRTGNHIPTTVALLAILEQLPTLSRRAHVDVAVLAFHLIQVLEGALNTSTRATGAPATSRATGAARTT